MMMMAARQNPAKAPTGAPDTTPDTTARDKPAGPSRGKAQALHGWLVVDKPGGMTSAQVVNAVKRILRAKKAGHAGTLDPIATGVLPIALGEATKTVAYAMDAQKHYAFTIRWGQATTTDDPEGEVCETSEARPDRAAIEAALPRFTGEITQVPPQYSSIKLGGQRAYDLARAGQPVELAPRQVWIESFTLVDMPDADHARFTVVCGKGAYMRALARDLARALGTCGHIAALRRLAVGRFHEDDAISLDRLEAFRHSAPASAPILPVATALADIPALALSEAEAVRLRSGQGVSLVRRADLKRIDGLENDAVVCAMHGDQPVAVARYSAGEIRPVRVLKV
jgi:tRNA pseudouridine55 synthase